MTSGVPRPGASGIVGIGTDLVSIERLEGALARRPRLERRLFTDEELSLMGAGKSSSSRAASLAARFATKEAVMKSLGIGLGGCGFVEIEVLGGRGSAPRARLLGRASSRAASLGVDDVAITMTHDAGLAAATAIAWRRCECSPS